MDHGYPCYARVKVTPLRQRAKGASDAEIDVDGDLWPEMGEARREALLDHELTHLVLLRDKEGKVRRDDLGRPKLRCKKHDMVVGGFAEVAKRHGEASIEAEHWKDLLRTVMQRELFAEDR